jgi:hypothetical protein
MTTEIPERRSIVSAGRAAGRRSMKVRKLHKRLRTHRTFDDEQAVLNTKAPTCDAFAEPSDGLEPSTPSLPCAPKPLPWVATGCRSAC